MNVPTLCCDKIKRRDKNNNIMHDKVATTHGRVSKRFTKQNILDVQSAPTDWINAFLNDN